jgi:vitamin D 1,25-hydroxylase
MGPIPYPFLGGNHLQILRELRQRAPVTRVGLWNGRQAWLVVRYADALRALTDRRLSTDATHANFPSMNPSQVVPNYRGSLSRMDEGRHGTLRNLVASKFTVRAARQWRPVSEQVVADQLAVLLAKGPPADLIAEFALPVPLRLVCRLLGVPERDLDFVKHTAQRMISRSYQPSQPALHELRGYVDELVRRDEAAPGDGLIGQLIVEHVRTGAINHDELVDLSVFLMVAGHTTTANTLGLSVLSLLEDVDRYRSLRDDPSRVVPMVEEFLRYQTIVVDGAPRIATRDLVLGGVTIRAGDAVIISLASANRDEEAFADPGELRLHRTGVHRHLAFGWGGHRCLGQHLARMELRVALTALARTIPTLRLAVPVEQVQFGHREKLQNGLHELPVSWQR